jgi:hypothetical protein
MHSAQYDKFRMCSQCNLWDWSTTKQNTFRAGTQSPLKLSLNSRITAQASQQADYLPPSSTELLTVRLFLHTT